MSLQNTFDIKLDQSNGYFDISIDQDGDIATEDSFLTSILMTVYCEKRALPSEMPESFRRRGWIGNESTPDFEIGSKVWLYHQERLTATILQQLAAQLEVDFQWYVDEELLESVQVQSVFNSTEVGVNITVKRSQSEVETRYYKLWNRTN